MDNKELSNDSLTTPSKVFSKKGLDFRIASAMPAIR